MDSTLNEVIKYNGKIAETIFCASSGGFTVASDEAWGGNSVPYLITHEDPYSTHPWKYELKDKDFEKLGISGINSVNVESFKDSKRVDNIIFNTSQGDVKLKANDFRKKIGNTIIKSTLFDIKVDGNKVLVSGNGYGHGVGMSQYGAVEMAKKGQDYKKIIDFYFPGTNIEKLN